MKPLTQQAIEAGKLQTAFINAALDDPVLWPVEMRDALAVWLGA